MLDTENFYAIISLYVWPSILKNPISQAEGTEGRGAKAGIQQEIRKREHYEKPSVKRKKKSEAARKRKYN